MYSRSYRYLLSYCAKSAVFTIRQVVQKKCSYFTFGMDDSRISAKYPTILAERFPIYPGMYRHSTLKKNNDGVLTHFFR
jgi:hypothetical protein